MLALIMCSALLDKRCLQNGQAHRRFLGSAPPPGRAAVLRDPMPASQHWLRLAQAHLHRVLSTCPHRPSG